MPITAETAREIFLKLEQGNSEGFFAMSPKTSTGP